MEFKVGDIIWWAEPVNALCDDTWSDTIIDIIKEEDGSLLYETNNGAFYEDDIDVKIFKNKEEAEERMKEYNQE